METLKRVSVTLLVTAGIAAATAGIAAAERSTVGGGVWERSLTGVPGQGFVHSDYHHPRNCHGATAVGTHTERAHAPAGTWARAEASRALANNQQYWRDGC
ncbi:lactococcin 972 family bacteriocin [Nocardiopsis terrae]